MGAGTHPVGMGLLERDGETRALLTLVDHVAIGRGGARLVEGPAGIGKTALLHAAAEYAHARGVRPLLVHASEFEGELAFGAVRDLLAAAGFAAAAGAAVGSARAAGAGPADMAGAAGDDAADPRERLAELHATFARIAGEAGPLLLCADDVQWLDAASLTAGAALGRPAPRAARARSASRSTRPRPRGRRFAAAALTR